MAKPRLTEQDKIAAANRLGIKLSALKAVCDIESKGNGFLDDDRPVILFERHVMYRQLKKYGIKADSFAETQPNIVNRLSGGYKGSYSEWTRLLQASLIHQAAAIESTSWGLFQIMGFHWQLLGYSSASAFKNDMATNENRQLYAFCTFILKNKSMHKALKELRFSEFARLYNGADYQRNQYDLKLAKAFAKYEQETSK
ncbi:N-acetylmuramidase family protein [Agitococcus lubricus]|uniref:Uncharacterized protein DUF3380 n=1 Tax=Agitococcus lubricus TaxID=1077255 RepID=A0A2T5J1I4_9GAMM|nr:N-acetylmuramidase family protein [Agitococcus lubricus]PTQ90287.1 uncharacterized protein DUF3380 [Agitococcus lubricus]